MFGSDGIEPIRIQFDVDTSGLRKAESEMRESARTFKRSFDGQAIRPDIDFDNVVREARVAGDRAADAMSRELNSVNANLSTSGGFGKKFSGKMSMLGVAAGTALGAGIAGAAFAAANVATDLIRGAFEEALTEQTLLAKTDAVIKSTGAAARVSAEQMRAWAGGIEALSGATQDEMDVLNAQNILATFTKVRNEVGEGNDIFTQAIYSISNLSTAMGQDLQSSAVQVGKALNDPLKGVSALQRVGVSFTEQQKQEIEMLVKKGKTLEAQKKILAELETQFGGATKAVGETTQGKIGVAIDSIKDALRSLAAAVLPTIGKIAEWFTDVAMPAITDFGKALGQVLGPIFSGIGDLFGSTGKKAGGFGSALGDVSGFIEDAKGIAEGFMGAFKTLGEMFKAYLAPIIDNFAKNVLPNLIDAWTGLVAGYQTAIKPALDNLFKIIEDNKPELMKFAEFVGKVTAEFHKVWSIVAKYVLPVLGFLLGTMATMTVNTIAGLVEAISFLVRVFEGAPGAIKGAWDGITGFFSAIGEGISGAFSAVFEFIGQVVSAITGFGSRVLSAAGYLWSQFTAPLAPVFNAVTGFFSQMWNLLAQGISTVAGFFGQVWASISGPVSAAVETISGLFQGLWDKLTQGGEALLGIFSSIWSRFQEPVSQAIDAITGFFSSLWETLAGLGAELYNSAKAAWDSFVQATIDVLSSLPQLVGDLLRQIPGMDVALNLLGNVGSTLGTAAGIVTGANDENGNPVSRSAGGTTNYFNVQAQGLTVAQVQQDAARRGALYAAAS